MHKFVALRRKLNLSLSQLTFNFKFLYLRNNLFFGPENIGYLKDNEYEENSISVEREFTL